MKTSLENRELNAAESLELIGRMIENTRNRLNRNSGRPFLLWGYTTVIISLMNYLFNITGCSPSWSLSWFLIPVIGFLLMHLFPAKKATEPRTDIDRIVDAVWSTTGLSLTPIFATTMLHGLSYRHSLFGLIVLVMAIATTITGRIVRSKIYTFGGYAGMGLSVLFALYDYWLKQLPAGTVDTALLCNEILIFAAIFVIMMIIPGHILCYRSNRQARQHHV
ncbi:MAG: hypothetical protein NC250_08030 [Alistipes senegalensis]|nr:hypothetical protein [Bacteroides cellulosilyticus]MCM1352664.1 hypothetical protein [Alistipes senegalensis]